MYIPVRARRAGLPSAPWGDGATDFGWTIPEPKFREVRAVLSSSPGYFGHGSFDEHAAERFWIRCGGPEAGTGGHYI